MKRENFITELQKICETKSLLMAEATAAFADHDDPQTICRILDEFATRFQQFANDVEIPFSSKNADQLEHIPRGSQLPGNAEESEKVKTVVTSFISVLQRYKFDAPFAEIPEVRSAIENFEFATTARVPPR